MAYCRECGKELGNTEKTCLNCGFPNPDWVEPDENIPGAENFQGANENKTEDPYDLDVDEVVEGTYTMPGSPGYVPTSGIKVISNSENDFKTKEVKEDVPREVKEEVITREKTFEEPAYVKEDDYLESDIAGKDESFEDTIPMEQGVVGGYIPPVVEVENVQTQSTYTPPNAQQGGYVPPTPPPSGNNYNQSSSPKGGIPMIPVIGIGVLVLAVIAFMFLGKKGGGKKEVADSILGKWKIAVLKIGEDAFDVRGDQDYEDIYIVFKEGKKLDFVSEDTEEGTWEKSGDKIKIKFGDDEVYDAVLEDGVLDLDLIEIRYYFTKDGAEETEKIKKIAGAAMSFNMSEEDIEEDIEEEEPEKPVSETPVPDTVNKDYWLGEWIGYYEERYSWGKYETEENMDMDVYGYIGYEEETQIPYLEVYEVGTEDPFISLYVDLEDTHINGKIGEEDAWVGDRYLTDDDSLYFTYLGEGDPPTIEIRYQYVDPNDENSGIEFTVYLRRVGVSWDDMDKKPTIVD